MLSGAGVGSITPATPWATGSLPLPLPGCVKSMLFRGNGEFFSWESVCTCMEEGFDFIIANKRTRPPFDQKAWYQTKKKKPYEFNSAIYKPIGLKIPCRFVAIRISKEVKTSPEIPVQCELFEDDRYTYRIFCTSLRGKPHKIISEYDKRADVEITR